MAKTLLIRTNEITPYLQLGWWNINNIPKLENLKYIFAHDGKGNITGAYEIKSKSWDNGTDDWGEIIVPYTIKCDYIHKLDKNGNKIKVFTKRVIFFEYTFIREDFKNIKIPKTKQGQGYPLQVVEFDEITNKIIINKKH